MSSLRFCFCRSWLLVVVWLACAGPAVAQKAPSAMELATARRLYDEGRAAAEARRWSDARAAWQASYELVPNALVLISLAGAQAQTGRLLDAVESYRRVLREPGADSERFAAHVQAQLGALEARIAFVRVLDVPQAAEVELDGAPLALSLLSTEFAVDPGEHVLKANVAGYEPWTHTVRMAEGEHAELHWQGTPLPVSEVAEPQHLVAPRVPLAALGRDADPPERGHVRRRRALWITAAVVVAGAVGTGVALALRGRGDDTEPKPSGEVIPTHGGQ